MKKKKSIAQVILRGQILIIFPAFVINFFPIVFLLNFEDWFLTTPLDIHIALRISVYIIGFFIGIPLAWLYWSFVIPKWRIWAIRNTPKSEWKNLMLAAIDGNLIWPPGHSAERTEIRSEADQREIEEFYAHIAAGYKREEVLGSYSDNPKIPAETRYYLSKKASWIELVAIVFITFVAFGNLIFVEPLFYKLLGLGILAYIIYDLRDSPLRDIFKKETPQVILNEKGVSIKKKVLTFYSWEYVDYIKWDEGKKSFIIIVENEDQKEEEFSEIALKLELLNVSHREFLQTAQVYMGRFDRNNLAPLN